MSPLRCAMWGRGGDVGIKYTNEGTNEQMNKQLIKQTNERTNEQTSRQTDKQTSKQTNFIHSRIQSIWLTSKFIPRIHTLWLERFIWMTQHVYHSVSSYDFNVSSEWRTTHISFISWLRRFICWMPIHHIPVSFIFISWFQRFISTK